MSATATPPAIPGQPIDPPPKATPKRVRQLAAKPGTLGLVVGIGYRAFLRFSNARVAFLAAGTTYYLFFSIFALLAFAYGVAAALGSEQLSSAVTEALNEAFPGLLGEGSLDPEQIKSAGQTASIIGLVGLLYGGVGGASAASQSIHLVYGAPKDSRNFVLAKARLLAWLLLLATLIMLSFITSTLTSNFATRAFSAIGLDWTGPTMLLRLASIVAALALDFLIVYLLLGHLGGIRPERRARVIGAVFGAIAIELLKGVMSLILSFALDKPQYGALAAPIGILLVLYFQSMAVYIAAALAGGYAERNVPIDQLEPAPPAPAST